MNTLTNGDVVALLGMGALVGSLVLAGVAGLREAAMFPKVAECAVACAPMDWDLDDADCKCTHPPITPETLAAEVDRATCGA